ncbi:AMP-binding protein [Microvirga sp. STS02]|uniref:AMP-binding protein n=1 Tax=Hymenobacter negativus TaxID=2795026 RepID=UPI0018DD533C|nr:MULTISPECIES: AMP-binding protein [Bacteria]MBH8570995.1 AMP-binding protein [Hymenobacter negativus]MBR7210733.1 AMP-binding protein [Microvirga sp. STS02]
MPATLPTSLLLNGREYAYAAIREYPAQLDAPVNGYEAKVLDFIRQWLNGTQEFTLTTSGSTGPPSPIVLRRRQLEASARRTADFFDLGPGDRALVCLNCEYIGGMMMLVRGLERNMHLTIVEPHADPFAYVAADAEFDFSAFVPLQLKAVLADGHAARLDNMKAFLIGGAPADASLTQELQPLKAAAWLTYGMTETCSHVALRRLNGPQAAPTFRVLPGIAAGQDERGCLTLRGDVTDDQLIVTNDVVQLLDAHTFEWLGRADFVINSGGVKVPAEKVELVLDVALAEIGQSRRCFVAGQPDERLGQAVTAFIEGPALSAEQETLLKALLAERLGRYEQPRQFAYVPEFQMTATGKLNRAATLRTL